MRAMNQSSPEPSPLYPLADPGNATASSKCLCQPLLPPGASPRKNDPTRLGHETRGPRATKGSVGLAALKGNLGKGGRRRLKDMLSLG